MVSPNASKRFDRPKSNRQFSEGQKSKGILDDYATRQDTATKEGTIQKVPVFEKDMVNKEYVDAIATRGQVDLFLTENASDIGTYFDLEVDVVTAVKENIVQSIGGSSTALIGSFVTILDEGEIDRITLLESGVYGFHAHVEGQVSKNLFIYCEFYHRTALGVETLLETTHDSDVLSTSEEQRDVHATISTDTAFIPGDRIVIKVYGRNDGAAARNITLYMEGDTASRAELPAFISLGTSVTATANLTDNRVVQGDGGGRGIKTSTKNVSDIHSESHTVASHSDTTGTGAELDTLTDGSETALHSHAGGGGFEDRGDPASADKAVGNFTIDSAWHDWDLSAIVPAGAKVVLLRIDQVQNRAGISLRFRKNGNTNLITAAKTRNLVASIPQDYDLTVACDTDRVIEYFVENVGTWAILNVSVAGWWF